MLEWAKILIPTFGAIVVFITWRSGKLLDLTNEFFKVYGETSGECDALMAEATGAKAIADEYLKVADTICDGFQIADVFKETIVEALTIRAGIAQGQIENIQSIRSSLQGIKSDIARPFWKPISIRRAAMNLGETISCREKLKVTRSQIEEVVQGVRSENVFEEPFKNTRPSNTTPAVATPDQSDS